MNARMKAKKYKNELDRSRKLCLPNKLAPAYVYQRNVKTYKSRRFIDQIDCRYLTPRDVEWLKTSMVKELAENLVNDGCIEFNQLNRDTGEIVLECTLMVVKQSV